jgi:hypothetical protein
MKINHLDDLDQLSNEPLRIQNEWIGMIPDKELYEIAIWLLHHLGPNRFSSNHKRSNLFDICQEYNFSKSWSKKQKFYLGGGVIGLWNERQIDKDPRYETSNW